MFEDDGLHFRLGDPLTRNGKPSNAKDLPRINHRAIIGDKRNDENVIVSQLQGVFLQFHNVVVDRLTDPTTKRLPDFADVQRVVRWHYQWVVLHDFLPKIVGQHMLHKVLPHLEKNNGSIYEDEPRLDFFSWRNDPFMPIEFAAAAYRFGHSMVRPIYRLNTELGSDATQDQRDRGVAGRQFIFGAMRNESLNGFRDFPSTWAIDWPLFFEFDRKLDDEANSGPGRVQPSYKIDSSLVNPLAFLPEFSEPAPGGNFHMDDDGHPKTKPNEIAMLALRNLLRGLRMGLPSGQMIARHMDIEPIPDEELKVGKANVDGLQINKSIVDIASSFKDNAPLWFYVLAEGQHQWAQEAEKSTDNEAKKNSIHVRLGPVGGRIVTEVLVGLMLGDPFSFLSQWPSWNPFLKDLPNFAPFAQEFKQFGIPELITVLETGGTNTSRQ